MKGLIGAALANRVAANLLAFLLVVAGLIAVQTLNVRLFPRIDLKAIAITVPYPGATPNEVETSIVRPIEERLEGLEGVRQITGLAAKNVASVIVDLEQGTDNSAMLDDIQTEIDRITVFPQEAEQPQVILAEADELALQIVIHGDVETDTLKGLAERVRSELTGLDAVSRVTIGGAPEYLIVVSVGQETLQALGLPLTAIADAIAAQSLDLSGGEIESDTQRVLVRSVGERRTGEAFGTVVVRSGETGTPVRLGDIAEIRDGLSESPVRAVYNGQPAVFVSVFRVGDEKVLDVAEAVRAYVDNDLAAVLPEGVSGELWRDDATILEDRINLLARNAFLGLMLVGLLLMMFLDLRIALWVAFGVGVSFVGTFMLMAAFDVTINQLSLFGFILAIGIVVDDAIVVGENIHSAWREHPDQPMQAAEKGVMRVATPVLFSVSTTIVAFVPLLFVPGTFGQFLGPIASVVIFVLVLSLVESFMVLPRHLSHLKPSKPGRFSPRRIADPLRDFVAARLRAFREGPLRRAIGFCVHRPVMVLMVAVGAFIMSLSTMASGHVKYIFFAEIEGDYVTAELELSEATSEAQTVRFAEDIAAAARVAANEVSTSQAALDGVLWSLGAPTSNDDPVALPDGGAAANTAFIVARIETAATRDFTAVEFENAWREAAGDIPGAQKLTFTSNLVGVGAPIMLEVSAREDGETRAAVAEIRQALIDQPGVFDVRDDRFRTTDEIRIELTDLARSYGVTQAQLAAEVRAAFFGAEAVRVQRDREEIEVRVRLPEDERNSLETIKRLRIPVGEGFVPIRSLANLTIAPAPATITRIDGRRVYEISADVDTRVTTATAVINDILENLQPELARKYEGLELGLGGEQEEQARAGPAIARNFILALMVIYTLLALSFRSYSQPIIVMLAIPFGFMGGLLGHAALGLNLTLLSMFGVIGLAGVIINNSLIVVDFINERLDKGMQATDAVTEAMLDRFRAILLTTLTTFLGVTPIILETSVQAQFLVPTAVALGFGILIGTSMLLFILPALSILHLKLFGHPNLEARRRPERTVPAGQ